MPITSSSAPKSIQGRKKMAGHLRMRPKKKSSKTSHIGAKKEKSSHNKKMKGY